MVLKQFARHLPEVIDDTAMKALNKFRVIILISRPAYKVFRFRFRSRFFVHQVLQQGKCLESGKHTNISKQQH